MPIKLGQTSGKVKNVLGLTRAYFKPALGKLVLRKPGVIRRSERVLERNRAFAAKKPAAACKGKAWPEFVACLSAAAK